MRFHQQPHHQTVRFPHSTYWYLSILTGYQTQNNLPIWPGTECIQYGLFLARYVIFCHTGDNQCQTIHSLSTFSICYISHNEIMSHCDLSEHAKLSFTYNMRVIYSLVFSSQLSLVTEPFNARNILPFSIATKHHLGDHVIKSMSSILQYFCLNNVFS